MPRQIKRLLADGWTATYTLGRDGNGATVISGLRVERTDGSPVPDGGLSSETLRQIPMRLRVVMRTYADLANTFATYADLAREGSYRDLGEHVQIETYKEPSRGRKHDDRFLLVVAQAWETARNSDTADIYDAMVGELRRQGLDYRPGGARELVNKARGAGLLEPTSQGRVGGGLTSKAKRLLRELEGDG